MECYFDNSATTKPCPEAVAAMTEALTETWGNPSSLHSVGDSASRLLEASRKTLAAAFRCQPDEVFFTGSGTEANNLAVFGTVQALGRRGTRIVTTCLEHPSVEEPMKRLEEQGFEVVRLSADAFGCVAEEDLARAITKDTILVSIMLVNNEVGSIQPVQAARRAVTRVKSPAYIHVDAVQAFGKLPVVPKDLGADLVSVSAHKVHGPKGVGALYKKKGLRLSPYVLGGGQEGNVRSGTQGMPAIAGFAAAVAAMGDREEHLAHVRAVRDTLLNGLSDLPDVTVNSGPDALPYILNLSLAGVPSEVLRNYLSEQGVYISTGSACAKGHRSPVLTAMELPAERIDSAVRISFSRDSTVEEAEFAAQKILDAAAVLRKRL